MNERVFIGRELKEALRVPLTQYDVSTNTIPVDTLEKLRSMIDVALYEYDETISGGFEDVPF